MSSGRLLLRPPRRAQRSQRRPSHGGSRCPIAAGMITFFQICMHCVRRIIARHLLAVALLQCCGHTTMWGLTSVCYKQELDAAAAQRRTTKAEDDVAAYRAEVGCSAGWLLILVILPAAAALEGPRLPWTSLGAFAYAHMHTQSQQQSQPHNIQCKTTAVLRCCRWARSRMQLSAPAPPALAAAGRAAGRRQHHGSRGGSRWGHSSAWRNLQDWCRLLPNGWFHLAAATLICAAQLLL